MFGGSSVAKQQRTLECYEEKEAAGNYMISKPLNSCTQEAEAETL